MISNLLSCVIKRTPQRPCADSFIEKPLFHAIYLYYFDRDYSHENYPVKKFLDINFLILFIF